MSTITVPKRKGSINPDFESIFKEHASFVYRTAYGVLGNREDADDILQTVFLRLLRRESAPDLDSNPKGYLYRAALNLSLDTIKVRRRQPKCADDLDRIPAPLHVTDAARDDDIHKRLYGAIALLQPQAAEILVLRYLHDMSDADIARMLGVSRTVVAVRLFRTRARLKKLICDSLGENS